MAEHSEEEFLRNQVTRLNNLLSRYQEAYPNFGSQQYGGDQSDVGENRQSWVLDKELSPLLLEYDETIFRLQDQIQILQVQLTTLSNQTQELVGENERLGLELRETIQVKLSSPHSGGGEGGGGDDAVISNLQHQIDIAIQEKETAQERWRETAQEVDRLELALETEKDSHQWRVVETQAHQVKDQYHQSVTALNAEVESLQNQLSKSRNENAATAQRIMEMKVTINDLQQQIIWKDQDHADNIFKEGFSDSKIAELKRIMEDLRQRNIAVSRECEELRRENISLHTRSTEIQRRLTETEGRENDAILQVREAVQMVEGSVLEKDQIEVLLRQKEGELEEIRDALAKVIKKAGARTREEVDNVRKQCNERIERLTEELHALEMEGTEKQARLDRLIREKRAVESELQQIYKEGMADGSKTKEAYHQLNNRAIKAERARDEANMKIETLQGGLGRTELDYKQAKELLESETKQLHERLVAVQSEFEEVNEDRLSCKNKLNEMDKKLIMAQQEKEAAQRKFFKELALIEQDQQVKTRDYEIKLQTTEDTRSQSVMELRRLLTAQQRMSAKWKEECQTLTYKFENKISDTREELSHVKKRNEQLTSLLSESKAKTMEVERLVVDYTKNIHRMEERVREAEKQAGEASKKLSRQSMRSRHLTSERETLLTELAQSQRSSTHVQAEAMSSIKRDNLLEQSRRRGLTFDQLNGSTNQMASDAR